MYGNAILRIFIVEQNGFQKSDNDLIYNLYMSLDDFNKENIPIPHPGGELNITLPNEIDTSKPLRINLVLSFKLILFVRRNVNQI